VKCPRCQTENREGLRFCEDCGARLAATCSACGTELTSGKKFCGSLRSIDVGIRVSESFRLSWELHAEAPCREDSHVKKRAGRRA
jgi:Double zinc ribbon